MSVSRLDTSQSAALQKIQAAQSSSQARSADGDYKTKGAGRSTVKDTDGDYKPASAQVRSTTAVQVALSLLKAGG
jgi:hypothetical protein